MEETPNAWYLNPTEEDLALPHQFSPNRAVSAEHLAEVGVLMWSGIETENYKTNAFLNSIKHHRGYKTEEVTIVAPDVMANFEANIAMFAVEHLHKEEEIRFVLRGGGYEDIRAIKFGEWIRIHIKEGDLILLPAGLYHRFVLDTGHYIKALLLYQEKVCHSQSERIESTTDAMEVTNEDLKNVSNPRLEYEE